jgi:hypothetical protein
MANSERAVCRGRLGHATLLRPRIEVNLTLPHPLILGRVDFAAADSMLPLSRDDAQDVPARMTPPTSSSSGGRSRRLANSPRSSPMPESEAPSTMPASDQRPDRSGGSQVASGADFVGYLPGDS